MQNLFVFSNRLIVSFGCAKKLGKTFSRTRPIRGQSDSILKRPTGRLTLIIPAEGIAEIEMRFRHCGSETHRLPLRRDCGFKVALQQKRNS